MHLIQWQQLFPQIFLRSYPFPVHLKSIFVAGASWKVVQGKTKLTLLIYVKSEEDDPLGPTPWVFICSIIYYGAFSHAFFSSDVLLLKSGTLSPTQRLKFWPPTITIIHKILNLILVLCPFLKKKKKNCPLPFVLIHFSLGSNTQVLKPNGLGLQTSSMGILIDVIL